MNVIDNIDTTALETRMYIYVHTYNHTYYVQI